MAHKKGKEPAGLKRYRLAQKRKKRIGKPRKKKRKVHAVKKRRKKRVVRRIAKPRKRKVVRRKTTKRKHTVGARRKKRKSIGASATGGQFMKAHRSIV